MRTSRPSLRAEWLSVPALTLALALVAWLGAISPGVAQAEEATSDEGEATLEVRAEFEPAFALWGDVVRLHVYAKAPEGVNVLATAQRNEAAPASTLALEERPDWLTPSGPWRDGPRTATQHDGHTLAVVAAGDAPLASRAYFVGYDAPSDGEHELTVELTHRLLTEDGLTDAETTHVRATLELEERPGGKQFLEEPGGLEGLPNQGEPPLDINVAPTVAYPGETVTVQVTLHMPEGMHTYPINLDAFGMPTELELGGEAAEHLTATGEWVDPEPAEGPKHIGTITFERSYLLSEDIELGAHPLEVTATFMPCIPVQCYMPIDAVASTDLLVSEAAEEDTASFEASFKPDSSRAGEDALLLLAVTVADDHAITPKSIEIRNAPEWLSRGETWGDVLDEHELIRSQGQLELPVSVAADASDGEYDVVLEIGYEYVSDDDAATVAANNPATVLAQMRIEPGEPRDEYATETPAAAEEDEEEEFGTLFWALLGVVAMAFLSLLTPCVFPMIPITIAHFVNLATPKGDTTTGGAQPGASRAKLFALAMTYAGAIFLTFTTVALAVTFAFGVAFAQDLASDPWLNVILATLILLFALSFFGLFELQMPSSLTSKLQSAGAGGAGAFVGTFLMGVGFTFASFACTGPILGMVVAVGLDGGDMWIAVLYTIVYAIAFALPFVGFAMAPGLMSKLPNSGPWMVRVKVVFAFVLLLVLPYFLSKAQLALEPGGLFNAFALVGLFALAIALPILFLPKGRLGIKALSSLLLGAFVIVSNAAGWVTIDLGLNADLLSRSLVLSYWAAILVVFAMYLLGRIRFHLEPPREHVGALGTLFAIVSLTLALYIAVGAFTGRPVFNRGVEAALGVPAVEEEIAALSEPVVISGGDVTTEAEPTWHPSYEDALAQAREEGKPLFLDFTGYFCSNCKINEENIFPEPAVQELFGDMVLAKLYVDADRAPRAKEIEKELAAEHREVIRRFGGAGAPHYMVVDPESEELLSELAGLTNTEAFLEMLKEGLAAYEDR